MVMSLALTWYSLMAITGSEWITLVALLLGTSTSSGVFSLFYAMRKVRVEAAAQKSSAASSDRTVGVAEAELALKAQGAAIDRLTAEVKQQDIRLAECEERYREHARICPLFKARNASE